MLYFTAKDLLIAILVGGFFSMFAFFWVRAWLRKKWQKLFGKDHD